MKKTIFFALILSIFLLSTSCKKCTTCTARDANDGEVKFEETSCANGPLLDDWQKDIQTAFPSPQYNTVCK